MTRRITQDDVAQAAGVSRFTVSCVVNNLSGGNVRVSDETRKRVLAAVEQLGYVPDRMARSLRTRKTYTIAFILPDITNPFYPSFARGIQDVARHHQYDLLLVNTDGIVEQERKSLQAVKASQVDGIIYSQYHLTEEELMAIEIPIVLSGPQSDHFSHFDRLFVDNVTPSFEITSRLILTGHTRIAILAGDRDTPPSQFRLAGYRQALAAHHLPEDPELVCFGDFSEACGTEQMQKLLELLQPPTAVFAANDLIALGAMMVLRKAGKRIPEDVALAGFDDIPTARYTTPSLTTVNQFQYNIGQKAAEMLFERIEGQIPAEPRVVQMPYELILRESSGTIPPGK
jgi:LacI family transcriptional regulator